VSWFAFAGNKNPVESISLEEGAPRQELITGEDEAWFYGTSRAFSSTTAGPLCRNREAAGQRPAIKPAAFDRRRSDDRTWGERSRQHDLNSVSDSADSPMDRYNDEPTLADVLSDPVTLAVMDADGVDPRDLAATLTQIVGKLTPSFGSIEQKTRPVVSTFAKVVVADREPDVAIELPEGMTTSGWPRYNNPSTSTTACWAFRPGR
jgi:hypothetical protein